MYLWVAELWPLFPRGPHCRCVCTYGRWEGRTKWTGSVLLRGCPPCLGQAGISASLSPWHRLGAVPIVGSVQAGQRPEAGVLRQQARSCCLTSSVLEVVQGQRQGSMACLQPVLGLQSWAPGARQPSPGWSTRLYARQGLEVMRRGPSAPAPAPVDLALSRPNATPSRENWFSCHPRLWWLTACVRLEAERGAEAASGTGGWVEGTGGAMADS
jgi:hypothetical protein